MTVDVSLAPANGYDKPKAAEISADGRMSGLASKSDGDTVSFTIKKGGYYAVAEEKKSAPAHPIHLKLAITAGSSFGLRCSLFPAQARLEPRFTVERKRILLNNADRFKKPRRPPTSAPLIRVKSEKKEFANCAQVR